MIAPPSAVIAPRSSRYLPAGPCPSQPERVQHEGHGLAGGQAAGGGGQYEADPETYREPPHDATSVVASMVECPARFVVTFQPAPLEVPDGIPAQIIRVIPHSCQRQVDQATGEVQWVHALPGTPGTEDFWDGPVVYAHPLLA